MNAQQLSPAIDITHWPFDDEYDSIYPKGARDKKADESQFRQSTHQSQLSEL
jgi:hypothetical protein